MANSNLNEIETSQKRLEGSISVYRGMVSVAEAILAPAVLTSLLEEGVLKVAKKALRRANELYAEGMRRLGAIHLREVIADIEKELLGNERIFKADGSTDVKLVK